MIQKMHTVEEVAEMLRLNPASVRKLIRRGDLTPTVKAGNKYLIPEGTLDAYVEARTTDGGATLRWRDSLR